MRGGASQLQIYQWATRRSKPDANSNGRQRPCQYRR